MSSASACSITGTINPLAVWVAMPEVDGSVAVDDAVVVVEPGVHLREVADRDDDRTA